MGIDWETMLDGRGAGMADAYDAHVASAEEQMNPSFRSSSLIDWDDDYDHDRDIPDGYSDINYCIDVYTVQFQGKYADKYLAADINPDSAHGQTAFRLNEHILTSYGSDFSIDDYSFDEEFLKPDGRSGKMTTANSSDGDIVERQIIINNNKLICRADEGKLFISMNGFECEVQTDTGFGASKENKQDYNSIAEYVRSEAEKADRHEYSVEFNEERTYAERIYREGGWDPEYADYELSYDYDYSDACFGEHKTDDGKIIVYYGAYHGFSNGMAYTEYTDENGRSVLCMRDHVLIRYNDENGRAAAIIDGNEFSEYDENGRHIVRINGYELVNYEENGETVGFINGVKCENTRISDKCENAVEAAEKNDLPKEDCGDIITEEELIEAKAKPKQTAPCDNCGESNDDLDDLPF